MVLGKTTTLGKLANLAVRSGYSAMIAAADTFRAAAVQQVEVWGERSDVAVVANPTANADPAAVVFDAIGAARSKGTDLLLVDTAGRLQTKHNLMEELQKIRRIVDRLAPESKVESLLVLDASQGQNGLKQAMAFAKAADLTGVVITKLMAQPVVVWPLPCHRKRGCRSGSSVLARASATCAPSTALSSLKPCSLGVVCSRKRCCWLQTAGIRHRR